MNNPFKAVDEFFSVFIEEEAPRFFFLNLPFWAFVFFVGWHVIGAVGLFLLWATGVFAIIPYVIANVYLGFYEQDRLQYYESEWTFFRVSLGGYVVAIFALIGIPGWYSGLVVQAIKTKAFADAYWGVIFGWWRFFNFYHSWKKKAAQDFLNDYVFKYQSWQWAFLLSAVVITPILFYRLYAKAQERAKFEELEQSRLEREDKERVAQAEARARDMEERRLQNEKRQQAQAELEKEKQKKIQEKIFEVRGKDPWDSGFL